MFVWYEIIFSGGIPASVVTTPLFSLGRMYVTWSYRNNRLFGRIGGTEQLHCSNSGETFCAAIAVSQTDSIVLAGTMLHSILIQANTFDLPLPKFLR